ncbi:hypothetical protein CHLRE_14g622951v5 [Chlamydomonas reinhardtii]|uniref:Uncharacterized protein n=1 Tax=Chlamydomonas reinhardtii TaxID=3055 RepID=A0A2K3CY43_CHLRE|nr:uncharacterized protein CHLRE_14g622951v5 [Chlamydomonas reinhardtii]PNW73202.1 hypothetical protein CHLRE_14g622951v5 [Chlamydomonas reinhardtii]
MLGAPSVELLLKALQRGRSRAPDSALTSFQLRAVSSAGGRTTRPVSDRPPCFDLRSRTASGASSEDEWGDFVSAADGDSWGDFVSAASGPDGDTPRPASPTGSRSSEAATSAGSDTPVDSRRCSSDSMGRSYSGCQTPSTSSGISMSSSPAGGSVNSGSGGGWAGGIRAMMASFKAKQRAAEQAEEARIAKEEAEAAAARAHEEAVAALMRNGATRPQAEALVRRRRSEAQRLGNRSLKRLPRQAQEIEGEKVQEGACAAALRRELAVVAHQASLFGGFR